MDKLKLLVISAVITILLYFSYNVINANEINENNIYHDKEIEKVTEELYQQINNQLDDIHKVLDKLDTKIENARNMEEYITYPAIRLDIDAPYFGIAYIIESKLVVHGGVSTFDVASGYSIREVVRKEKIKIATFDVADIVILTRDLNIDKNMTLEDAKIVTVELVKYYEQAIRILELTQKNLNDTFKEYLSDDKNNLINEYKQNVKQQEESVTNINNKISQVMFYTNLKDEIDSIYEYYEIINNNKKTSLNLLLSKKQYVNNIEEIKLQNEKINKFNLETISKYEEDLKNVKLDVNIQNILLQIEDEMNYLEKFIKLSKKTDEEKEILNYIVSSNDMYLKIKEDINKIKDIQEKLFKEYEDIKLEMLTSNNDSITIDIYSYNENENIKNHMNELNKVVEDFYTKYNLYLIDNIETNIKSIKSRNDLNVYEYEALKYIYYDMQVDLDEIFKSYNNKDLMKSINTKNKLVKVLNKILESNVKLSNNEI